MRAPPESEDLRSAAGWLAAKGLRAEPFSKSERKQRKTPDFRIYRGDRHVGFCEVKSPRDDWLADKIAQSAPFQVVGGGRPDPTFNRISHHIATAVEQFDAVNPDRTLPNILVFINWADAVDVEDLRETLTGYREVDGERIVTMPNIAEGRMIGTCKHRVDLYVWIDGRTKKERGGVYTEGSDFRTEILQLVGASEPRE